MKKWTLFITLLVFSGLMLSACSSAAEAPAASVQDTAEDAAQATEDKTPPVENEEEVAEEEMIEEAAPLKVAIALDGKIDDNGWNQAGYEGVLEAQERYGVEIAYSESIPIADFEKSLRDYASQGYDVIICHSSIAKDAVINTATDYPDQYFLWTDGDTTLDNMAVMRPLAQEASYLAGILAGSLTETNIIGMVGGIDIPSTHRSYAAFEMGVKEINPDAEILVNWIGSFLDVAAGKEAALAQIEAGADIIFGNGDGQNIGVLKGAGEKDVLAIGGVQDQFEVAPNVVLTSVLWGFQDGIAGVIGDAVAGNFEGKEYSVSLKEGSDLAPYHDNENKIPEEVRNLIEQKHQEILDGTLEIPDIPIE